MKNTYYSDWNNAIAVNCGICKKRGKIFIERMRRVDNTNKFYCDGCGNAKTQEQLKEEYEQSKTNHK